MKGNYYGIQPCGSADVSYPVKKEVGKVGEDSPLFIVPLNSAENKSNIANFFSKPASPAKTKSTKHIIEEEVADKSTGEDLSPDAHSPGKRKIEEMSPKGREESLVLKKKAVSDEMAVQSPVKTAQRKPTKRAPPPTKKSPVKREGASKITNFFTIK